MVYINGADVLLRTLTHCTTTDHKNSCFALLFVVQTFANVQSSHARAQSGIVFALQPSLIVNSSNLYSLS